MRRAVDLRPASLGDGVVAGFSTRAGGVSEAPFDSFNLAVNVGDDPRAVRENRAALEAALGVGAGRSCWAEQVHGAQAAVAGPAGTPESGIPGVDALVTDSPGVLLCIRVADCLPVLLADGEAGVIGVAHAGRRGLVLGVLDSAVLAMESLGADRGRMQAVIGPAICGRCYEVPEEMAAEVEAALPGSRSVTRDGTPSIDLPGAARRGLESIGIAVAAASGECTMEHPDTWYSYRRAARTGRFVGYAMLQ